MRLPAAVLAGLGLLSLGGRAVARDHHHEHHEHKADARQHLERANALAGDGKWAEAVKEYTAAYDKLQDPILLFNRAECYRRLGENAKAAEDYRGFLKGFPAAPNRAELEARIATLEKAAAARAPARPTAATGRTPGATPPPSGSPRTPPATCTSATRKTTVSVRSMPRPA